LGWTRYWFPDLSLMTQTNDALIAALCVWTIVALVLLALSPMLRPGAQDARQHAALAAALLIGAQLLLGYWFYSYITWWYPLLIIAIIRARPDPERSSILYIMCIIGDQATRVPSATVVCA
jgi:hypothetical protein